MRMLNCTAVLLLFGAPIALADILGPTYPSPSDLSSNRSFVRAAWQNVSAIFDAYLKHGQNTTLTQGLVGTQNVTFSAGLFSLQDDTTTKFQYHYTAPQVADSLNGTKVVDGNSIYRVASVSKLFTVFAGLRELSEADWVRPLTCFFPSLTAGQSDSQAPSWNKITPRMLASQLSGIQSVGYIEDLLLSFYGKAARLNTTEATIAAGVGLPPKDLNALGPCLSLDCTREDFIAAARSPPPAYPYGKTPAYSDLGFMLLGAIISQVTGKPLDVLYEDSIFKPLELTSTFANAPTNQSLLDRSVVVGPLDGSWSIPPDNNAAVPSGGLLSTINDLNKLGIAILNSTLLTPEATRMWMKPQTHTASFSYSIGAPWEIVRYVHKDSHKITDIYTKLGDSGAYGGMVAIIPDYDAGFTFLNAYYELPSQPASRGESALKFINHIAEALLPALEAQAAAEASKNYVATYSSDCGFNDTIVVTFNQSTVPTSASGLSVQQWISNGTDMLEQFFDCGKPQLLLSIPNEAHGAGQVHFKASDTVQYLSYESAKLGPFTGFYASNFQWATYDGPRYAGEEVYGFVFDVGDSGTATSVTNLAVGRKMKASRSLN